jgi:hypothetical protein
MARFVFPSLTLVALGCVAGCVAIDGGAVEASWDISDQGRGIADCDCTCPPIAKVRFRVVGENGVDVCAGRSDCEFACSVKHGATHFDIPAGKYALSLVPIGKNGEDLTVTPVTGCSLQESVAPTLREVRFGQPTQLDAIEIAADCAPICGGSDNTKVCTKP